MRHLKNTERVGDAISAENANWTFSGEAVENFDAHIERSVPFYKESHELIARLSDFFLYDSACVYDLGCSSGTLTRAIARRAGEKSVRVIGIDCEKEMVARAKRCCADFSSVEIVEGDLIDFDFADADFFVSYLTMQFIRPRFRQEVIRRIYRSLRWGGAFILFEKVRAPDARFHDMMTLLYQDYKVSRGYTGDEIVGKARSLKGVLEPFSTQGNRDLLKRAGFVDVMTFFKYACFEGFLAIK